MIVLARAATYATLFVGLLLVFVPRWILERSGLARPAQLGAVEFAGIAVAMAGGALALWCIVTFALVGRGTPAPFDPPRTLVVQGPYRHLRNPMYLGAVLALCGAAIFFRSTPLFGYAGVFLLASHLFVVGYEEPTLARLFGAEYDAYRARVGRWGTHGTVPPWWRGAHGEWYVAGQVMLMATVFLGPRTLPGQALWPGPLTRMALFAGVAIASAGACLLVAGLLQLGHNLTPLPYPRTHATLVRTGPYRLVRHPMYSGGIGLAFGWALVVHGWLTLGYATALLIFLDIKSSREERWLTDRFPDYPDYRRRVHKLIPFIY